MRSANNSLSWRDVKLILAASARKNDPDHTGWETGAPQYGIDAGDPEYYDFNHSYGFGVVDAKAAVDLADGWSNLPPMRVTGPVESTGGATILTSGGTVRSSIAVDSDIEFIEFVEVNATFDALDFRDLQVELVSPSGSVSVLSVPDPESLHCPYVRPKDNELQDCALYGSFR